MRRFFLLWFDLIVLSILTQKLNKWNVSQTKEVTRYYATIITITFIIIVIPMVPINNHLLYTNHYLRALLFHLT